MLGRVGLWMTSLTGLMIGWFVCVCVCGQRQSEDGERRDAGVPGGAGGPPGRAQVPRRRGRRLAEGARPRRHGARPRRRSNGLPLLSPVDGQLPKLPLFFVSFCVSLLPIVSLYFWSTDRPPVSGGWSVSLCFLFVVGSLFVCFFVLFSDAFL